MSPTGQGIRAVGVDTIVAEIGISKRTLYNLFPSKDTLIAAYLARRLRPLSVSDEPQVAQILGFFERLERGFAQTAFPGCPFFNAVAELKEPRHAASRIALDFKEHRRAWFRDLLRHAGAAEAGHLGGRVAAARASHDAAPSRSAPCQRHAVSLGTGRRDREQLRWRLLATGVAVLTDQ